jgi:ABC-type amino acid transport substrate-binding protein
MKKFTFLSLSTFVLTLLLAACSTVTANQAPPQQTVVINPTFQSQVSPVPATPKYRCGAWASNNAPGTFSTITIYARLVSNLTGIAGATATAVAHFHDADVTLDQQPQSDDGGYVSFSLSLQGRQPQNIPATVDVTFTNCPGGTVKCTPAFFTPE